MSPCRGVKLPAKRPTEKRVLTVPELHRLADAMEEPYKPAIYLAAVCSLRWEEVAGLRVGAVNFLRKSLEVREAFTDVGGFKEVKTPSSRRTIPCYDSNASSRASGTTSSSTASTSRSRAARCSS